MAKVSVPSNHCSLIAARCPAAALPQPPKAQILIPNHPPRASWTATAALLSFSVPLARIIPEI